MWARGASAGAIISPPGTWSLGSSSLGQSVERRHGGDYGGGVAVVAKVTGLLCCR